MKAPCHNCKERDGGCHDKCNLYREYKEHREEIRRRRSLDSDLRAYGFDQYIKRKKMTNNL